MPFEYRVEWGGSLVTGPGVSVFHGRTTVGGTGFDTAQALADRCRKFFLDIVSLVPSGVSWTFPNEVTELQTGISETTGQAGTLLDVHAITPPATVNATATAGNHSRASGGRVDWNTESVVAGRRLRGRTYIVPLASLGYDSSGSLATTCITTLTTAGNNFKDATVFSNCQPVVWSRSHGIAADIVGASVDDRASILRSRRD